MPGLNFSNRSFPGGIPSFASTLGYNRTVFLDTFDSEYQINHNQVNNGNTQPGFTWYKDFDDDSPDTTWLNVSNSVCTLSGSGQNRLKSVGSALPNGGNSTVGTSLSFANGIYFETKLKFSAVQGGGTDFKPNFYGYDMILFLHKLNSETTYGPLAEIDLMEARPGATKLQQIVHIWQNGSAIADSTPGDYSALDMSIYHTHGFLVKTMAANSGTGSLQFYIDRVASAPLITWTSGSTYSPLEMPNSTWEFNFVSAHDATNPYSIDYVAACSL